MSDSLFEIVHLKATSHGYQLKQTDYDLMPLGEAWAIVGDLTKDAIANESDDRWTVIPASYHGRPYKAGLHGTGGPIQA